jgi:hypothetical protein
MLRLKVRLECFGNVFFDPTRFLTGASLNLSKSSFVFRTNFCFVQVKISVRFFLATWLESTKRFMHM